MLASDMRAIASKDTFLPGLEVILDGDSMRSFLTEHALQEPSPRLDLQYIRYKPMRRALSLWNVAASEGPSRCLVVSACNATSWRKAEETGRTQRILSQGGWTCSKGQLLAEWFPFDHCLKSVAKLYDPSSQQKLLQRVLGDRASGALVVRTLSYKPGKRFVAKVFNEAGVYVLKCYHRDTFQRSLDHAQQAIQSGLWSSELIGASPKDRVLAMRWMDGTTLDECLLSPKFPAACVEQVGWSLADWQCRADRCQPLGLTRHEGHSLDRLHELGADLTWLIPEWKERLDSLVTRMWQGLECHPIKQGVIHGDFYAKQIVVHHGEYQWIDFDEMSLGDPYQDVGNFIAQLYWNEVRGDLARDNVEALVARFLEGYARRARGMDPKRLACQIAIATFRCLPHPFRRGHPEWRLQMERMLHRVECTLDESGPVGMPSPTKPSPQEVLQRSSAEEEARPYLDLAAIERAKPTFEGFEVPLAESKLTKANVVRHKFGRRILIEYHWSHPDHPSEIQKVLGKARIGKGLDRKTPELHQQLRALGMVQHTATVVPRVLGFVHPLGMWLQEKLEGAAITCGSPTSSEIHRQVGHSLSDFHRCPIELESKHQVQDELELLWRRFDDVETHHPDWAEDLQGVRERCLFLAAQLPKRPPKLIHRDFYFDQVLALPEGIAMLDLDLATMGPPELDVGNYLAHLDEYAVRFPASSADSEKASQHFLEGYLEGSRVDTKEVECWRYLSLARHIAISQRIRHRCHTTRQLIDRLLQSHSLCC